MQHMKANGIETGTHYSPVHKMSLYKSRSVLPNTEKIGKEIVTIPIHPNLSKKDVDFIIENVNSIV